MCSIFRVRALHISVFDLRCKPVCIAHDRLETSLYTATLPDQYCEREEMSMLINATHYIMLKYLRRVQQLTG